MKKPGFLPTGFLVAVSAGAKSAKAIRCAACNIAQKMAKVLFKKPGFLTYSLVTETSNQQQLN
jgi:hypothetical protein